MASPTHSSPSDSGRPPLRVAFLLSRYPAISHTFFLKEVLGLRDRGMAIEVASINPPDRAHSDLPEAEAREAAATYYVKPGGWLGPLLEVIGIALGHPFVALRGLRAALSFGAFDLKARAYALFYLAEALLVGRWMRRRSLEHLHVHFGGSVANVGLLAAAAWQFPWSITLHGPDEFFDQQEFYLARKIQSAAFVICISDFCRSQVLRIVPQLPDSRIEVVRLGVDCVALHPSKRPPNSSATVRLVCTGRMVAAKGHRILLDAIAQASRPLAEIGFELSCDLVGDGPERSSLESLCRQLGIAAQVRFLGAQPHHTTLDRVAEADIFVLASFAEGLPVALMEAMALGVPCISTTIAAIPELILDGVNGRLVRPANPADLSAALQELARDPHLRRRLGQAARATVEQYYDLSANLDRLTATWRRKLDSHAAK